MSERERRLTVETCPHCLTGMHRLTLSWDELWVEVEECDECGAVVMDDAEGPNLDELLRRLP